MSEELIKRLRRAAQRLDAPRYASDAALLNEAADALSRPAPVQVPEGYPDGFDASCGIPAEAMRAANALLADMKGTREWDVPCAAARIAQFSAPAAPAVDAQRVMALVEDYGDAMFAAGISCAHHEHRNERDYRDDADEAKAQIRALLTAAPAGVGGCTCEACVPRNQFGGPTMMSLCPECGDKRCPKAKHHGNACTAAPASVGQGWIPVGERRPGVGVVVLGFWKNSAGPHSHITGQNYGITARNEHGLWYDASEDDNEDDEWIRPDYWQPLPAAPAIAKQEDGGHD